MIGIDNYFNRFHYNTTDSRFLCFKKFPLAIMSTLLIMFITSTSIALHPSTTVLGLSFFGNEDSTLNNRPIIGKYRIVHYTYVCTINNYDFSFFFLWMGLYVKLCCRSIRSFVYIHKLNYIYKTLYCRLGNIIRSNIEILTYVVDNDSDIIYSIYIYNICTEIIFDNLQDNFNFSAKLQ